MARHVHWQTETGVEREVVVVRHRRTAGVEVGKLLGVRVDVEVRPQAAAQHAVSDEELRRRKMQREKARKSSV